MYNFEDVVYRLPRQRGRELRSWLRKNFQLVLEPPVIDGYTDEDRLTGLLLKSLSGQAHTLWASVKQRPVLGVLGEYILKNGEEKQIAPIQVLTAIREDLADFPGFSMGTDVVVKLAPQSYRFPPAPNNSRYVVKLTSL